MTKKRIETNRAPAAIGPYCQAVVAGDWVYCSGQLALDPDEAQMVGGGDIATETEQVLKNLDAVLEKAGASRGDVVKATVYLDRYGRILEDESGLRRLLRGARSAGARDGAGRSPAQRREGRNRLHREGRRLAVERVAQVSRVFAVGAYADHTHRAPKFLFDSSEVPLSGWGELIPRAARG